MRNLITNLLNKGNGDTLAHWVPAEARLDFPTTVSIEYARENTLMAAREKVIRSLLPQGVEMADIIRDLYGNDLPDLDEKTARSMFSMSSAAGYILDEKIIKAKVERFEEDGFTYRVQLSARVLPNFRPRGSDLHLDLKTNKIELIDGEELTIKATSNCDGYLYLFDFLSDQSVVLMYPLKVLGGPSITANTPMRIPPEGDSPDTAHYRVMASKDRQVTVETLYGVFCRKPVNIARFLTVEGIRPSFSAGNESFHLFQRLLSDIPPEDRAERAVQIHIRLPQRDIF